MDKIFSRNCRLFGGAPKKIRQFTGASVENGANKVFRGLGGLGLLVAVAQFLVVSGVAATLEVGPGQSYVTLGAVPWMSLNPGDTVNIHYQTGGYHEIVLLSNSGTSNAPITINGIPDPATGRLPTIDGQNAITAAGTPWNSLFFNFEGVLVISRAGTEPYGYIPSWITIQNLHIQNADPACTLTESDGTVTNFDTFATCIYVEYAQHVVIRGCELNGSCNGFFCNSKNNDTNELSADMLIEHCWIHDNGYPGNYGVHNIYTEARGVTFQYNLIGPLRAGADGEQIKDRSSGTVLRYNMIIMGPGPGTAFWFEQTQGGIGIIDVDPAYKTNFVYGNVFYNPPNSQGLQMFRYDALGIQGQPRNGTLYFYNNTVVNYANQSGRYYTEIFSLPSHSEVLEWNVHDVVDCRNNIFASLPATAGGSPTAVSLLGSDDSTINLGTNWISVGARMIQLPYGATNFFGSLTGTNQLFNHGQIDPGFVSAATTNFQLLSTSIAIDAAGAQAPAVAASTNALGLEYVFPTGVEVRPFSGPRLDLGAFEGVSTNPAEPVYLLTVDGGTGGGSYPAGANGAIYANPASAGQIFDRWIGATVGNLVLATTSLNSDANGNFHWVDPAATSARQRFYRLAQ